MKAKKKRGKSKAAAKAAAHPMCQQPDRDEPRMVCGYPLPCPWHTAVVDATKAPPTVTVPASNPKAMVAVPRLAQVAEAVTRAPELALPSCKPGDKLTAELNADGIVEIRKNDSPFIFMSLEAFRWFRRAKLKGERRA